MKGTIKGVQKLWDRYKYVGLVILMGVGMLLWPSGIDDTKTHGAESVTSGSSRDLETELADMLGVMNGVGQVRVMLTLDSDGERQLAQDTELSYSGASMDPQNCSRRSEIVLAGGSGGNEAVVTRSVFPTYRGALVVCQGGDRADVKLAVTEAVAALTGLPADRITVAKWQ